MSTHPKALVVVDVQDGLDDAQYGPRNNPEAELRIAELLSAWRSKKWPVIFSRHNSRRADSPLRQGAPGNRIKPQVAPLSGELVVEKSVNSIFKADGLIPHLKKLEISELVFVGIATDACISASAREAKDLGFSVWVSKDACATFDRRSMNGELLPASLVHKVELAILHTAGIHVAATSEILKQVKIKVPPAHT